MPKNIDELKEIQAFLWDPPNSLPLLPQCSGDQRKAQLRRERQGLLSHALLQPGGLLSGQGRGTAWRCLATGNVLHDAFLFYSFREAIDDGLFRLQKLVPEGRSYMQKGFMKVHPAAATSGCRLSVECL